MIVYINTNVLHSSKIHINNLMDNNKMPPINKKGAYNEVIIINIVNS